MSEITIKDIATSAGVSISTVSRVINGNYPVSQEAREKVESVMRKFDYHPNVVARSLRINKTNFVALVVADLSNFFFMELAKGLEQELARQNYQMVIASSGGEVEKERELIQALTERRIDALVIASVDSNGNQITKCIKSGIPVVLVDRTIKGITTNQILWNDFESAYQLTKLLIQNGHHKIAIVNVKLSNLNGYNRLEGYKKALEEEGIEPEEALISPSNFSEEQAYKFVKKIMMRKKKPTAIFCANNIMLEGTLMALRELNLQIYKDVSVVALGNLNCNKYINPQITSAGQDSFTMGKQAGKLLMQLFHGKNSYCTQMVMDANIVERESVRNIQ